MGVSSSAGPDLGHTGHRPLRSTFLGMVVAPAVCLAVLWVAGVVVAVGGVLGGHRLSSLSRGAIIELIILIVAGLLVLLVTLVLAGSFARRVARDVAGLTLAARRLAAERAQAALAAQTAQITGPGEDQPQPAIPAAPPAVIPPRRTTRTTEIAHATAAIADLQQTAIAAAASEAGMRDGLRQVIVSLARRNQSLLQRQLRLIDTLEQKAADPGALADLFALDHLTTRMRRHAESLAILADAAPGRSWREPVPVIDVIRGAMAEVEDYQRVAVLTQAEDAVSGSAAADMIHLLAELIENATLFSPSGTPVEVRAGRVANGFAIEVDDRGLGIEPGQLKEINRQLDSPPDFDLANSDRLGLFVGGKLASRYGVRVSLRQSPYGGTTAIVLLPNNIVVPAGGVGIALQPAVMHPAISGSPAAESRAETLALVGPRPVPSSPAARVAEPGAAAAAMPPAQAVPPRLVSPVQPVPPTPLLTPRPAAASRTPDSVSAPVRAMPSASGAAPPAADTSALPTRVVTPSAVVPPAHVPPPATPVPSSSPASPRTASARAETTAPDAASSPASRAGSAADGGASKPPAAPTVASVWSVPPGRSVFSPAETPPPPGRATAATTAGAEPPSPPGSPSGSPSEGTYRGLPRRTRQASLSPHLRDEPARAGRSAGSDPLPAPLDLRAPEEARDLAASLQSGWQRGRETELPGTSDPSASDNDQAERDPAAAPGKEK